jgi:hypothetical protein
LEATPGGSQVMISTTRSTCEMGKTMNEKELPNL